MKRPIVFLIMLFNICFELKSQNLCNDPNYSQGGFSLSSADICHNETLLLNNTSAVEDPKYYHNYKGETYNEILAKSSLVVDFSNVTQPQVFTVIQVGKKDGKETVFCQDVKVRVGNLAVSSYNLCGPPPKLEISLPLHSLNDYSDYQININGTTTHLTKADLPYKNTFNIPSTSNQLKVTGSGSQKVCTYSTPAATIPSLNGGVQNHDYYPEIMELRVLQDKTVQLDIKGQYNETYNLHRYAAGGPVSIFPIKTGVSAGIVTDNPTGNSTFCYFVLKVNPACGQFVLRSADLCTVNLTNTQQLTQNNLQWTPYRGPTGSYFLFPPSNIPNIKTEIVKVTNGVQNTNISVSNTQFTYSDTGLNCSEKHCYKIKVTNKGYISGVNYSGTSYSNEMCDNHKLANIPAPKNIFTSTENDRNILNFEDVIDPTYPLERWELFDGNNNLINSITPPNFFILDPNPVIQPETYRLAYVDKCKNHSLLSEPVHSVFLEDNGENSIKWTNRSPFSENDINQFEILYLENDVAVYSSSVPESTLNHKININEVTDFGTFRIKALASNGLESFSNTIKLPIKAYLYLPTAFSPNQDGLNDNFELHGSLERIKHFKMEIWNSQNQKVTELTDPKVGWNGNLKNGKVAPSGSYIYQFEAIINNGQTIKRTGTFTLVR